jgi:phosphoglycolate phosphatase
VAEALTAVREAWPGIAMAVLTNKPAGVSREICAHFGLDRYFFQVYGGNSFHTKKPDPAGLLALMAEASALDGADAAAGAITAGGTVMIGDSEVDILTARNCGARSIGCSYGLSPQSLAAAPPDALVASAAEWPAALRQL